MNKMSGVTAAGLRKASRRIAILLIGFGIVPEVYSETSTDGAAHIAAISVAGEITSTDNARLDSLGEAILMAPAPSMSAVTGDAIARTRVVTDYGKLPIRFEPNVGQAPGPVKYLARGAAYTVALTDHGATLNLLKAATGKVNNSGAAKRPVAVEQAVLQMNLVNSNTHPTLNGERLQTSVSNYFIGNDRSKWRGNVTNYGAVRYLQVYSGIDWVVYGNPQQLEYDLVVAPNADPKQIRLQIDGASSLALDTNGDLLIQVNNKILRQLKPVIYQISAAGDKQAIDGRYVLDHEQVTFAVADYDHSRRLVIDPVFAYSTFLGGNDVDQANTIAVDSAGNAYIAGYTGSANFPTASALQGAYAGAVGGTDAFVAKLNAAGNALVYSTYLGGSDDDGASAIALDSTGNAYVAGYTGSTDFPTASALQSANAGAFDVFVAKLNASGSALVYSTYVGGSDVDHASAIAVNSAGEAFVAGYTISTDFPTAAALQSVNAGGNDDAFVTKLNASGSALVYSTYLGGSDADVAYGIALDSEGNAYVVGRTWSINFPTASPLQSANAGAFDAFVSKLNATGSALVYSTYLGGSDVDQANAITVDSAGNAYIAGYTGSANFPIASPLQSAYAGGGSDAFVTKLNAAGSVLIYSTYLGGGGDDGASAIALDSAGSVYIAGYTESTNFPTLSPLQAANAGIFDAFVTKLNANGSALVYSTYLGGNDYDRAAAIAVDSAGEAYVAGFTISANFPTSSALQNANDGNTDAFVSKIIIQPAPPAGVTATASNTQVRLSWSAVSGATSYNVYQGKSAGGEASAPVRTNITGTSVTISGLVNGTAYYFEVSAVDATGESAKSAEVSATPYDSSKKTTVQMTMSPQFFIKLGKTVTLIWSTKNATGCTASGNWNGSEPTNGSVTLTPATKGLNKYTLTCTGPANSASATKYLWVTR